jgi:hypothetical protein
VRAPLIAASCAVCVGLVFLVSWWFDMSLGRAVILAPVIVVSFGALAALIVLWTRVALDPIIRRRRGEDRHTLDTNP